LMKLKMEMIAGVGLAMLVLSGATAFADDANVLNKIVPGASLLGRDGKMFTVASVDTQGGTVTYSEGTYFQQTIKITDVAVPINPSDIGLHDPVILKGTFGSSQVYALGIFTNDQILVVGAKLLWDKTTYTRPVCSLINDGDYRAVSREDLETTNKSIDDSCSVSFY
jgi:hypothetical protein